MPSLSPQDSRPVIRLRGVHKRFEEVHALQGLDLALPHGIVGVLGPNGAGKSTLFRLILGLERAEAGEIEVLGWPLPEAGLQARAEIGYMPEDDCVFPDLNGGEQVVQAARLCGLDRVDAFARAHETLDLVGLTDARYRAVSGYSLGMRQRLRLAMALVHGPRLLLLDEPTAGLDPAGRAEMLTLVGEVGEAGVAVLLSTHVLGDVEAVCDHVALLSRGRSGFSGPMSRFRAGPRRAMLPQEGDPPGAAPGVAEAAGGWLVEVVGDRRALAGALERRGVAVREARLGLELELSPPQMTLLWEAAAEVGVGLRHLEARREGMAEAFVRHLRLDDPTRRQAREGRGP